MKKIFTLFTILCAMSITFAQTVPNASFEDWTDTHTAVGWNSSFNVSFPVNYGGFDLTVVLDYNAATRYADGHTGTYSAQLIPQQANAQMGGFSLYSIDLPGMIQLGQFNTEGIEDIDFENADLSSMDELSLEQYITGGIAFNQIPEKITAWVAYSSPSDTLRATVMLTRWNNGTREVVARGDLYDPNTYTSFTMVEVPVSVNEDMEGITPDTLNIIFSTASGSTCSADSRLTIDDVEIVMPTGVCDLTFPLFSVSPNPADETISLTPATDGEYDVRMFDTNGKLVWEGQHLVNTTDINVTTFTSGVYFMQIRQNGQVKTQKVVVK